MSMLTEREQQLLTKAVDGELTPAEQQEWEELMRKNPALREEFAEHQSLKEVAMEFTFKKPPEETWDRYWAGVYARIERGLAWLLVSIGAAVVLAYAGYQAIAELISDETIPWPVKIATAALLLGLAVLVVSVLREKWFTHKSDKYREVIR